MPPLLPPFTWPPYPPKEGTISFHPFAQKEAVSEPFSIAPPPQGHPLGPFPLSPQLPHPGGLLHFRRRPPSGAAPGPDPGSQGRLPSGHAPQPLASWEGGGGGPRGGQGGWGGSSSVLGGDWLGRGEGAGLLPVSRGSRVVLGILRSSTSGSGDFDAREDSGSGSMSDKRPAVDTQARRLPDSFKGEPRAPGEARGSPAVPFISFREEPQPKAPGISEVP